MGGGNPIRAVTRAVRKAGSQLEDNIKSGAHNLEETIKKPYERTADNLGVGNVDVDDFIPENLTHLDTDDFLPEGLANIDTDDFIPEDLKKGNQKVDESFAEDVGDPTGNLTPEESAEEARKRLGRIGRFFTTVLGDTSQANTGRQRVFS